MESLSARDLLRAWEQGVALGTAERGLLLLGASCPDLDRRSLSALTVGERDRLLFTLREQMFGSSVVAVALCPNCGERAELTFQTADVVGEPPQPQAETIDLQVSGYAIKARLITCSDLVDAGRLRVEGRRAPLQVARDFLIERSIEFAEQNGMPVPISDLPPRVIDSVSDQIAAADPLADIQLGVTCAACAHSWEETLDISSFLWTEIEGWAQRTLLDVHRIASAYGWSESEILGMSAWRRHCYLRMIGQ